MDGYSKCGAFKLSSLQTLQPSNSSAFKLSSLQTLQPSNSPAFKLSSLQTLQPSNSPACLNPFEHFAGFHLITSDMKAGGRCPLRRKIKNVNNQRSTRRVQYEYWDNWKLLYLARDQSCTEFIQKCIMLAAMLVISTTKKIFNVRNRKHSSWAKYASQEAACCFSLN